MSPGTVVIYRSATATPLFAHEQAALEHVARSIARITELKFGGCYNLAKPVYGLSHVPDETLLEPEARALNIRRWRYWW